MKVSVSLPDEDVEFVDEYARTRGFDSRTAVLHNAVRLLRTADLGSAYADAWQEWEGHGEAELWESAAGDGLGS